MSEQKEFFSPKHKRILNIAVWAKYLAWIALIISIFYVIGAYVQERSYYNAYGPQSGQFLGFLEMLKRNPSYSFGLLMELINIFVRALYISFS